LLRLREGAQRADAKARKASSAAASRRRRVDGTRDRRALVDEQYSY